RFIRDGAASSLITYKQRSEPSHFQVFHRSIDSGLISTGKAPHTLRGFSTPMLGSTINTNRTSWISVKLKRCLKKLRGRAHQNHSLPKLGTENTPQCMKMPNLDWSNHSGSGLESMDSQVGSYLPLLKLIT
ncbi:hypothetical protein GOODEAATRI_031284, partial [Goodea atripinnis]